MDGPGLQWRRSDPFAFDVPDEIPETTEDADAARDAFKALLDYEEQREQDEAVAPSEAAQDEPVPVATPAGNNGHTSPTPLQTRVYEYNDAGMTVAQIAKEMGVGKGEVRLILSLRKERKT